MTRNGTPVAELRPVSPRRFVPRAVIADAARAHGRVFAAVRVAGRMSRSRVADLLIASTAAAHGLPVYTRNPADLEALASVVRVVAV